MVNISQELRRRLVQHGQAHLLEVAERLDDAAWESLVRDLERIDLAELLALYERRAQKDALPERQRIQPLPIPTFDAAEREAFRKCGEQAFRAGAVAFLLVAGGQGTRLGFDDPKGMFPIGPVSKKPLFQIHAEKVLALKRRYGARMPLLVMTSPATDEATRKWFTRRNFYRLPPDDVWFFCQGTMPALDLATGRLLLDAPGRLCLSPNGHGGTITGLFDSKLLERLKERGIRTISYFQVDNPLVNLADCVFLGRHLAADAAVSSKVLPKTGPKEKVGNFALLDGRCAMIEYSDLPDEWAAETDERGQLVLWAGNPAIHLFDVAFLLKIAAEAGRLPWHLARKKVPFLDEAGKLVTPEEVNALKFERFIFDVLPQAERWSILPTVREEEFAPVKNKDGEKVDTPTTARALMCNLAAKWLREAGVEVPTDAHGNAAHKIEISPLLALDAAELRSKLKGISHIDKDTYIK